ncbi:MAG: MBOAT family protein [Clostridia bacterium]|nr:MBOAT family protein [Clostridia bacterium]
MSTLEFVGFTAAVLLLYYLVPRRAQSAVLLAANVFYCLSAGLLCLLSVIGVTTAAFCSSVKIERAAAKEHATPQERAVTKEHATPQERAVTKERATPQERKKSRRTLVFGLVFTLSSLVLVKLFSLLESASVLFRESEGGTLGLAFYSLSASGYLIDLYRGKIRREKSFLKLFIFVGFFPCIRLGPISRYSQLSPQLNKPHAPVWENIVSGAIRMLWGYFKKLVVADTALVAVRAIVAEPQKYGGGYIFFLIILYSVAIYADFTGGIDIALGASRMLDISLAENFDRPFSSESVREYWKRWHITLGAYFTDYVFYPLSISRPMRAISKRLRKSKYKKIGKKMPVYIALVFTWFLTGAWHGLSPNFILWGLSNAAVIIAAQELSPLSARFHQKHPTVNNNAVWRLFCVVRTFLIIGAIRIFDLWGNALTTPRAIASIFFDARGWKDLFGGGFLSLGLSLPEWIALAVGVALIFAVSKLDFKKDGKMRNIVTRRPLLTMLVIVALVSATAIFGSYGVGFDESSFIYSQF